MPRNPNCTACNLCQSTKNVCVWGHGEGEGFMVGEAPGEAEARTGKPFMGQSGQLLRRVLEDFDLGDAYITNAAKCRPPKNRRPEPAELKACKPYLLEEIETRKPKAILLLGAIPMKSLIGKTGITEMNGQIVEKDGQKYVCCFHPAYILRDPSKMSALRMAIGRYAQVLKGEFKQELPDWEAVTSETFEQFIADWEMCERFSFDTESSGEKEGEGLQWWKDGFEIESISFTFTDHERTWKRNWGISTAHPAIMPYEAMKDLLEYMVATQEDKVCEGQNVKWDNKVIERIYGVKFRGDEDCGLIHHLIDENSSHALKLLARQFLGAPDYDLTDKEKKNMNLVPVRRKLQYNCADSFYTDGLVEKFRPKLDDEERWLYERVVMPASRAFERIERNGLFVDLEFLNKQADESKRRTLELEAKLNEMAGRTINWNSPAQVGSVLYGDLGLIPTVLTDKGNASTGEEALVDLDHPIVKVLIEYREQKKYTSTYTGEWDEEAGTYVGGWREFMDGPHLYLPTKITGTVTGRYSSRLHQTPRDGAIRNAVTAPPGWDHGQMDLSQAELRVIAILSRDPEMLRCFKTGEDIHWRTLFEAIRAGGGEAVELVGDTADKIAGGLIDFNGFDEALDTVFEYGKMDPDRAIDLEPGWKEWRKKAKGINFGFCFDQSPQGFIGYAKTKYGFEPTLEEATTFHGAYFNLYRSLPAWHNRQRELCRQDGFVRAMSGRKRHLPGIYSSDRQVRSEAERQAINAPVQGFIGDYKAMILVELDQDPRLTPDKFRLTAEVHDAILFWVKREHREYVLPIVYDICSNPKLARECGLRFPIDMSIELDIGERWGKGKKWKPN